MLRNPLNVEVTFSGLTAVVQDAKAQAESPPDFVEVEVIDDLILGARESRTVSSYPIHEPSFLRSCHAQIPIAIKCAKPASLIVSHVRFDFLSLLPVTESLAVGGRRLHDTPHQRQNKIYAPDTVMKVDVEDSGYRLHTGFIDNRHLVLFQGETRRVDVRVHNSGKRRIDEVWIVSEPRSEVWVDTGVEESGAGLSCSGFSVLTNVQKMDLRALKTSCQRTLSRLLHPTGFYSNIYTHHLY